MLEIARVRKDFPILGSGIIYLDSAATSQRPIQVIDAVSAFYKTRNANVYRGLYRIAEEATLDFETVREKVRKFIGSGSARETVFTKNTTEGANIIMRGWGEKYLGNTMRAAIRNYHLDTPGKFPQIKGYEHYENMVLAPEAIEPYVADFAKGVVAGTPQLEKIKVRKYAVRAS